jgi:hypothetical protein
VFLSGRDFETQAHSYQVEVSAFDGIHTTVKLITVNLTDVNEAPTANPDTGTAGENETKSFNVLVNDTDQDAGDTKTLSAIGTVTVTSANGQVNGINAAAAFTIVGNEIRFTPGTQFDALKPGQTATVVVDYTMRDSGNLTAHSSLTLTINGRNDAPDIDSGNTISYNANNGGSVVVDPNIKLSDIDGNPLNGDKIAGATIAITTGRDTGDQLLFANQNGITGSFNAGTGVLTLTGNATLVQYETALKSVRFASTSGNDGPRTISWRATDGLDNSAADTTTVNVRGIERHHHRGSDGHYDDNRGNSGNFYSSQHGMVTNVSTGERWNGSIGSGYTYINADIRRVGLDGSLLELQTPVGALADALGGDAVQTTATLLDGKALPDWLKFDPQTGILAGKLPANVVASIQPNIGQETDDNIVTGSTGNGNGDGNGNGTSSATHGTISVQITSRDAQGNIATTIFTIDLAHKQSWIPGNGDARRHAAIELQRALAGSSVAPMTFMAPALDGIEDTLAGDGAGRVGLSQQLDGHGWRAMHADRMALIASLPQSAAGWR